MLSWMLCLFRGARRRVGSRRGRIPLEGLDLRSCVNRISHWVLSTTAFISCFSTSNSILLVAYVT